MSRKVSIEVFSVDELSSTALRVALAEVIATRRIYADDPVSSDFIKEYAQDTLRTKGYSFEKGLEIQFRFSYSQGDGIAFYGGLTNNEGTSVTIRKCGPRMYDHERTMELAYDYDDPSRLAVLDDLRSISRDLFDGINCMISASESDEVLKEYARESDLAFYASGKIFRHMT